MLTFLHTPVETRAVVGNGRNGLRSLEAKNHNRIVSSIQIIVSNVVKNQVGPCEEAIYLGAT